MLKRRAEKTIVDTALKGLRSRAEGRDAVADTAADEAGGEQAAPARDDRRRSAAPMTSAAAVRRPHPDAGRCRAGEPGGQRPAGGQSRDGHPGAQHGTEQFAIAPARNRPAPRRAVPGRRGRIWLARSAAAPSRSIVTQTPAAAGDPRGAARRCRSFPARRSGSGRWKRPVRSPAAAAAAPRPARAPAAQPPQGGPASPAGDMLSGMQRWLIRSSARTMRRELEGQVRRTLGGGRAESKDVWGTATTEPPGPTWTEAPECAWCPICRAARRMRESGPALSSHIRARPMPWPRPFRMRWGRVDGVLSRTAARPRAEPPADRSPGQGDADSAASDAAERAAHEPGDRS